MANAIYLSTIGVRFFYAVEGEDGIPKADLTELKGVKSIPSMNPAPETLDTTTLNEKEYKTSLPGLKDLGGALQFTFNLSNELKTTWDALMTAYEQAKTNSKNVYFYVDIPSFKEMMVFPGVPSAMGCPEMGVNSVLEIENSITPVGEPTWETKEGMTIPE